MFDQEPFPGGMPGGLPRPSTPIKDAVGKAFTQLIERLAEAESDEERAQIIKEVYDERAEQFRPFLRDLPTVAELLGTDVSTILQTIFRLGASTLEDEELQQDHARLAAAKAKHQKATFDAYVGAGFSEEQAMQLLIADKQQVNAAVGGTKANLKSGTSS